ncbi:hypothetical protein [Cohnella sp. REN36]|uniref:hypothetical protein n=1 Tax=Cohnella sp. REN36 TaxID=2887347 RepID=UPI001D13CEBC|nr:hypothetical protein [Cohnella sp. REN36]MCC3373520.1 hypothetical protein [Cohnella sp. REN36]
MDKRKVIAAYRFGLISAQECAQILGLDNPSLLGSCLLRDEAEILPDPGAVAGGDATAAMAADPYRDRRRLTFLES